MYVEHEIRVRDETDVIDFVAFKIERERGGIRVVSPMYYRDQNVETLVKNVHRVYIANVGWLDATCENITKAIGQTCL